MKNWRPAHYVAIIVALIGFFGVIFNTLYSSKSNIVTNETPVTTSKYTLVLKKNNTEEQILNFGFDKPTINILIDGHNYPYIINNSTVEIEMTLKNKNIEISLTDSLSKKYDLITKKILLNQTSQSFDVYLAEKISTKSYNSSENLKKFTYILRFTNTKGDPILDFGIPNPSIRVDIDGERQPLNLFISEGKTSFDFKRDITNERTTLSLSNDCKRKLQTNNYYLLPNKDNDVKVK